ncbi:MAG: hypothetical protein ACQEWU_18615 [Bacillota bacterium]|uniref:hypothetical protein n=1 Tax=Virgibacillus TaxID=84406 RepID=UPI00040D7013|nr:MULTISPECIES: hypothetical protein [Bacillaceae]WBX81674.1 hypothetical protein PD280_08320 [Virgibacillus salarius]
MIITSSYQDLLHAKQAIAKFKEDKPAVYQRFVHVIQLTRQLQFNFQYMGCLIMDEDAKKFRPAVQDEYILNVYNTEIEKLKEDQRVNDLKQLLHAYKQIGYSNLSGLVLGKKPISLVGPKVV